MKYLQVTESILFKATILRLREMLVLLTDENIVITTKKLVGWTSMECLRIYRYRQNGLIGTEYSTGLVKTSCTV